MDRRRCSAPPLQKSFLRSWTTVLLDGSACSGWLHYILCVANNHERLKQGPFVLCHLGSYMYFQSHLQFSNKSLKKIKMKFQKTNTRYRYLVHLNKLFWAAGLIQNVFKILFSSSLVIFKGLCSLSRRWTLTYNCAQYEEGWRHDGLIQQMNLISGLVVVPWSDPMSLSGLQVPAVYSIQGWTVE